VEYAKLDGVTLHLQIITPQTRNTKDKGYKYPCIVYVQGSAWMKQNINAKLGLLARLAEKGYVIAVVEYRHSGIAAFPAVALDTRNAIRFMKVHADEYMVDVEKMFVGGDSSGGHAAMFSQTSGIPLKISIDDFAKSTSSNKFVFPFILKEFAAILFIVPFIRLIVPELMEKLIIN